MAQYQFYKKQSFPLKKDARAWAAKIKKQNQGSDNKMKVETNYLSSQNQWEAVIYVKQMNG